MNLAKQFRKDLATSLGKPVQVILFGSEARGEGTQFSDIDLFVILPNLEKETLDIALDAAWAIGFKAGRVISVIPAAEGELEMFSASPFFQTVQREGIVA